ATPCSFRASLTLYRAPSALFFFIDTATTDIYTLSLHDALPISQTRRARCARHALSQVQTGVQGTVGLLGELLPEVGLDRRANPRSEEHTSELQSLTNLVCRLLLEKKKKTKLI